MHGEWVPAVMFGGLFLFLILRSYFRYKLHASALEKGQALPETPKDKGDLRKPALVLITLGLGFMIAMHTTLSFVHDGDTPEPIAISIWGIVPILIGGGQWLYWRMAEKERLEKEERAALPLT
ncbi:MAG: hypothetical protein IT369_22195 [Candidatus Latescibacteria bacterium]|nr:hypothetical protein [Candidatus Latescibacterota bacterium]